MTAFNQPTTAEIRQTINSAGTILMSRDGLVHFDLNNKSTSEIDQLRRVLRTLADFSGSTVEEGVPHPLTQSAGTMLMRLNQQPNFHDQARIVRDGLFFSGNCYCYEIPRSARMTFSQYALEIDHAAAADFASQCRLAVLVSKPNSWGLSTTRTLAEDVVHAVALNVKMPNTISFEAFVPTTLYDRDPVKAVVVEAYLRTLAARHGDVYERTPMMIEGHTSPVVVHRIHGFGSCHELESRTQNPTLTFLADVRAAITSDISQYSTAYNVPIVPQREEKGSILESLGIQSAPLNGERSVDVDLNAPFLR